MKIPFLGQAYQARSPNLAADRLVNLYPEPAPEGKEVGGFFGTPGLAQFAQSGAGPIRGAFNYFNVTYFFVSGSTLYFTDALNVTPQELGTIGGTGRVMMTANQEQKLFIVTRPYAYIYDLATATLTLRTDLPAMGGSCDFISQFFIFEEKDNSSFYIFDGVTFDPLDVGVAEGMPDHLVRVLVDHREAWLFGQLSTEVWAFTGAADFPLEIIPGALIPQGCVARFTPARLDNSVFWLGRNEDGQGVVWRANGYTPARVSTHAVEFAIASYGDLSDAFAETYQQEGHSFYVLTFPTAGKTWVFDAATSMWHERASLNGTTGDLGRWRPNTLTFFQGEIVAGDSQSGKLFTLSLDNYTDGNYGPVTGLLPVTPFTTNDGASSKLAAARVFGSPTGYFRTEILTLVGGTYTTPAQVMVAIDTAGGTSAANVVTVVDAGDYTVVPSDPVSTTGGSGSGLVLFAFWTTGDAIEIETESGAGYTAPPTLTFEETYGAGAAATANVQLIAAKGALGTGYVVGDDLTLAGGTFTRAATVRVEEVTLGAPSALAITDPGEYTVVPTGLISLTGGTGTGGSCTGFWGVGQWTITNGGDEYARAPTVTITGLGVGASFTAEVDATTNWIKWIRSCRALPQGASNPNRTTHHALQLYGQMGVGLDGAGQGTDPQVMLRWSDDGGHTWSNEHWRSMGRIGQTGHRCIWRRLGSTEKLRDRVYEFSGTDPVKRAFTGAELILTGNAS